jgi:hypothetical protein
VSANADPVPRALCVLDRDGVPGNATADREPPGFEFFTWPRRHIESYLLVADAIRCSTRLPARDPRVDRLLQEVLPRIDDEESVREIDAKKLLTPNGPLSRALGAPIHPASVARCMNRADLHADVLLVLDRLRAGVGLSRSETG